MQISTNAASKVKIQTPATNKFNSAHRALRLLCMMLLISVSLFNKVQAQYSNVPVVGFNTDIVADGTTNIDGTASTTIGADAGGYVFVTPTFRPSGVATACNTANTYPSTITSTNVTNNTGIAYTLQPATSNNNLRLGAAASASLTLSSPVTGTSNIYIVGLGGEGATNFNAVLNFSDATSETLSGTLPDWCGGAATYKVTAAQYYRFGRTSTTCSGGLCQYIYEIPLNISPANYLKTINSITFTNTSTGTLVLNVLAIGRKATCAVPADGPTAFTPGATTSGSVAASFTAAASAPSGYLTAIYPTGATPVLPVNGTAYTTNQTLGTGKVVQSSGATSFTATGLSSATTYDLYVYPYNLGTCGGPIYNTSALNVLTGTMSTAVCSGLSAGTYSVGPTGTYLSLTAALTAVNGGITGPVVLELQTNYTSLVETFPLTFPVNSCVGATNTLTIRPQAGATGLSITSSNTTGTINFNGARYVTIDGRPGGTGTTSQLTISNTNAGASYAVQFTGDATNNALKYCTITSLNNSVASGTIVFGSGTTSGNDNNIIDNCSILDGTSTPLNGIYSAGASTSIDNSGNIISNNNIANYFGAATAANGIYLASNSSGWTISGNRFYQTVTRTPTTGTQNRAIQIVTLSGGGYTITGNIIGFANAAGTGTTTYAGTVANRFVGIELTSSNSFTSSIQGNTISNISVTTNNAGSAAAPVFGGIVMLAGNADIGNTATNTIGGATGTAAIIISGSATSFFVDGIYAVSTGTVNIVNNRIGSINAAGSAATIGCQFYAIWGSGTAGNFIINGNIVGSTATANSIVIGTDLTTTATSTNQNFYGIRCDATGNTIIGALGAGNTIQNVSLRSSSSAGFYGYYNGAAAASVSFAYNTLTAVSHGFTTTPSTGTFYGFYNALTVVGTLTISNNNLINLPNLNTTGTVYLTYNSSTTATANIQNNTFNNISRPSTAASGTMYCHYNGSSPTGPQTFSANTITNISSSGSTSFYGLYNGSNTGSTWNIFNNTISTITAGSGSLYGMYDYYGAATTVNNNTINNLTSTGTIYGFYLGFSITTGNIFSNTIYSLASSGASSTVYGFNLVGSSSGTFVNTYKNKVYDLLASGATGTAYGIYTGGGNVHNIYNNLVGDIRATTSSLTAPAPSVAGLYISSGTTINAYYNTFQLNASSTGTNFGSAAVYASTTPTVNLRNNIFVNNSTPNGTGLSVAYQRSNNTLTSYASTSNNNLFYSGTPSATRLIYFDVTNADQTFGAFQTRVSPRDAGSVTENPPFLSTSGASANFLHISTATATQLESAGAPIATYTDDYDGDPRSATTPDIGADEFAGILSDQTAPGISAITLIGNACSITSRNLTAQISDPSGVDNSSLPPTIYFRKNGGAYSHVAGSLTSGNVNSGTWTFTITYSTVGGVVPTDVIDYFIVAQDVLGNASGNPSGGLVITNVNTVTSFPTTPLTYNVQNSLSGTFTVGTGGTYPTLTAAVAAYNNSCLSGPVIFSLISASYTEAAALTVNANVDASATNTLTIKPTLANTTIAVTGGSTSAIFILNGADYVTIDGSIGSTTNSVCPAVSSSRDLTITNSNSGTSSAVVWLQTTAGSNAATNNKIKNCNLVGNSNTTTLIAAGSGSATISLTSLGTGNNNNAFENNNISKTQYGIYSQGASAASKNTGTVINQNLINNATPNNVQYCGVMVGFEDGISISGNNISGLTTTTSLTAIAAGISPTSISVTATTGNEVTNATITKNQIGTVVSTSTTGYSAIGISLASAATGTSTIANNMIYGVSSLATASDLTAGIYVGGGTATTRVYYNTVSMTGSRTAATYPSYALAINGTTPVVDVRNNILYNTQTSTGTGQSYAIGLAYSSTTGNYANLISNNNDLFTSGASAAFAKVGNLAQGSGTNIATLAVWTTETGRDAASKNLAPVFTSGTDLHLYPTNTALDNFGTPVSVTDDIDCQARSGTAPDMGADEFTATIPVVINSVSASPTTPQCVATARTITANITAGGSNITSVTLNYSFNGTAQPPVTMTGGNPNAGQTSNWTGIIPAATPSNATVTWKVTAIDGVVTVVSNGTTYADNPLASSTITANASPNPACAGSAVALTALATVNGVTKTLGAGGTTPSSYEGVLYNLFGGQKTQFLVKASELTAIGLVGGNITSLSLNFATAPVVNYQGFAINIAPTALTALTSTLVSTGFTQVYAGTGTNGGYTPTVGINAFGFGTGAGSSPTFAWDGTSNIIIQFCYSNNNSGGTGNSFAKTDAPGFTCGAYYASDNKTPAVLCPTTAGSGTLSSRPQFIFVGKGLGALSTYTWNDGTSNVGTGSPLTVNPLVNTNYTVTGTDANGCTITSSPVSVTVIAGPPAPTPNNSTQCGTGVPTAFVGSNIPSTNTNGFRWYNSQFNGTLIQTGGDRYLASISTTTSFWVSETNGTCESQRVELIATVGPADPVQATSDNNDPCRNTAIQLSAANSAATPLNNYTYSWNASPLAGSGLSGATPGASISVTPTVAGTFVYTVTATDVPAACVTTATVTVIVKPLPTINSTTATPSTVCAGASVSLSATSGSQGSGPVTIGAGATTISGTTTGQGNPYNHYYGGQKTQIIYTKAELNAAGMSAGNITALAFNLSALGSSTLTMADFTINIGHTTQSAAVNPLITSGLTQVYGNSLQGVTLGLNNYTFSTPFNWNNTDNIVVSISWSNVNGGVSAASPVIVSDVASFVSTSYIWADNTSSSALFTASSNTSSGVGTTSQTNTTSNRPQIVFTATTGINTTGSTNWVWNPGALPGSTVTVNPTTTTIYTVTATNPTTTCSSTATVTVTVNPLPATPSGTGSDQCGTIVPTASVSSNSGATTPVFKWYTVPTGGTAVQTGTSTMYLSTVSVTTDFYVAEVSAAGCEGARVMLTVTVSDPDPITVTATPSTVCLGGSTSIAASYTPDFNSFATYTLTVNNQTGSGITNPVTLTANGTGDGSVPYTVTPTAVGTYIYTITANDPDKGCTAVNTITVTVGALPTIQSFTATPSTICAGASVSLVAIGAPHYTNVAATGYNTDEVANGVGAVSASTTGTFDAQYTFAASDWNFNGTCTALSFFMPVSGKVNGNATVAPGVVYTLQSYTANNALRVPATGTAAGSGTLTVTNPVSMKTIYLLYGAGNGPLTSGMNVTVTFTDATTQVFSGLTALDWYATTNPAISNLGRLDRTTTPACATTVTSGPQLFDLVLALNASNYTKLVQSIKVDKTATTGTINVMAVAMEAPAYQTQAYNWTINPGGFTDSAHVVNPTTTTTYTATVTNPATTCSASATVTVTVNQLPAAPSTNDPVTRCGPGSVTLTATGTGGTLKWYNVATGGTSLQTGGTYTTNVTGNTSFWVAETSGAGCEGPRTQVHVTVTTAPTLVITAGGATTFCQGSSVTLNGASGSSSSYVNFAWSASPSAGSGLSSPTGSIVTATPTIAGTYIYTLTADDGIPGGCANTTNISVTMNPNPVITSATANPATICSGGTSVLSAQSVPASTGTAAIGAGASTSSSGGTPFYGGWGGTKVQYIYKASELLAAGFVAGPITSVGINVTIVGTTYNGFAVSIGATTQNTFSSANALPVTQVYSGPLANQGYLPTVGLNTFNFTSAFNWDGTSNIVLSFCYSNATTSNPASTIQIDTYVSGTGMYIYSDSQTPSTVCGATTTIPASGGSLTTTTRAKATFGGLLGTNLTANYNWTWTPGPLTGATVSVSPTATTNYTVTATNQSTGCSAMYSPVTVTVTPVIANATATPSTPVCAGSAVSLSATATGGAPFTYSWSNGTTVVGTTNPLIVNPTITTTYTVTVKDVCNNSTTSSVTVTVNPLPTASIAEAGPITICSPSTQVLTAVTDAASPSYQWTLNGSNIPGATGATYTVSGAGTGTYRVIVTNTATTCVSAPSTGVVVTINQKPSAVTITPPSAIICNGASATFTASGGTTGSTGTTAIGAGATTFSGTTTGFGNPYNHWYGGIKEQIIYTKAELNATGITGGNIFAIATQISALGSSTLTMANFTINIGHTTQSAATTTLITSGLTQVYSNASQGVNLGANTYTFNIPFNWNNIDNIVISISWSNANSGSTAQSATTVGDVVSFNAVSEIYADNTTAANLLAASSNTSSGVGTTSQTHTSTQRPKISFTYSTVQNPVWNWSPATGLNITSGATVIASPSTTQTYTATATVNGCTNTANVVLTVNPRPTGVISGSTAYCNGQPTTTNLSIAVTGAGPWNGTITNGTTTTPFSGSSSPISVSVTPTATTTFTIATLNGSACSSIAADLSGSATVTVNSRPTGVLSGGSVQCSGAVNPTALSIAVTGAGPWNGTLSDGTPFSGTVSPISVSVSPSSTTTYTIASLTDANCTSIAADLSGNATITVNSRPTGTLSGGSSQCAGSVAATTLNIAVTGTGPWSGTLSNGATFGGSVSPLTVSVTPSSTTTYTIATLLDANCTAIAADLSGSATVTVNPRPTGVISGGATYCANQNTTTALSIAVTGTGPWNGTLSDGTLFNGTTSPISVSVTPTTTTTYTIATLTDANCTSIAADLSGSATITINPLAANPTANVTQPTCTVATGTITVTSPLGAGTTYSLDGGAYQSSTTFNNVAAGTHNLTAQTSSGCFSPASTSVTVNPQPFTPAAPVISGTVNVCPYIGTGTQLTYTATAAGATSFNWSIPANVMVVSGMGTGTLVVTFSNGFAEQAYKQFRVTATSICGTSSMTVFYLLAQYPSTPSPITGPANTCPYVNTGTIVTYTIPAATSATSYAWTVPAGAHIVSGQGTTSIGVTYDLGFAGGTMSVNSVNSCGPSGPRTLTLTARAASQPSPIAGPTNACAYMAPNGTPATYTTAIVNGATTYTWTTPANTIVTHPNGLGSATDTVITVLYPAGFTSGTVTVTATNGCGTSPARSLNITRLNPGTPSVIDVIQTHFCGEAGGRVFTYTLASMPYNTTSVQWTVPAVAMLMSGQGTTSITVSYPNTAVNGSVTAQGISNCGAGTVRSSTVKLPACPPPGFSGAGKVQSKAVTPVAASMEVKVFPNPTVSAFKMEVLTSAKEEINVRVIDAQGKLYKTFKLMPYQTIALGAELKAGSYLIEVRQGREVRTTKVIKF